MWFYAQLTEKILNTFYWTPYILENYIAFKRSPFKEWIFFQTRIVLLDYLNRLFMTKYALKYCTFQFNSSRNLS